MSQWLNEAYGATTNTGIDGSSTMMSFSEFYSGVREHFSKNPTSYEQFKNFIVLGGTCVHRPRNPLSLTDM